MYIININFEQIEMEGSNINKKLNNLHNIFSQHHIYIYYIL